MMTCKAIFGGLATLAALACAGTPVLTVPETA